MKTKTVSEQLADKFDEISDFLAKGRSEDANDILKELKSFVEGVEIKAMRVGQEEEVMCLPVMHENE